MSKYIFVFNFQNFAKLAKIADFAILWQKDIFSETVKDRVKRAKTWDHKGNNVLVRAPKYEMFLMFHNFTTIVNFSFFSKKVLISEMVRESAKRKKI